ncbi:Ankyrin repeat-containing domain protein [Akanthomyces lecanii RCEF 1005]|uniref:Ankyrin repeat-containing domain protein n=1 Tax=Akanthomyces lecanii RCEF 1005 TaxID=1081108 RepID=A0A168F798_CORDF|nr:Ankyrin repeat-containing domain protein [Akanthomyces lecanii RCEF 1005]
MSKLDKIFQTEQDILQLMRESRLKDKEETVLQELFSARSSYASDKDFNPTQVQGTCEWLFSDQTFCCWRDDLESDLFWISAGPGCGKSVLSRALVDHGHLQSNSSTISFWGTATVENRTATICYFFFKDDSSRRNKLSRALCAILHQLFSNQATKALISHAVSAYQTKGKALMEHPHSLWNVLARCADEWSGGAIICLLDALDECQSNDRFSLLTMLEDYYSQDGRTGKLKFLITSRPYDDIEQSFQNLARRARFLHFDGDEKYEEISSDINRVIDARMDDFAADFEPSDPRNGNAILVKLLLSYGANARTSSQATCDSALFAAAYTGNGEIFRAILAKLVNLDTLEGVEAAVVDKSVMGWNTHCMSMLISVLGPDMPLTQRMVEVLMEEVQVANKVLRMIISRINQSILVTPYMFEQALKGVDEEALECAARFSDVETMGLLLKQCAGLGAVTCKVLKGAIMSEPGRRADMLRFLLNRNKDIVVIDEDVVWVAASSNDVGLVKLIVSYLGFMAGVTHDFISTAIEATKRASNAEIVKYLLEQNGDEVVTSDAVVADAARYGTREMMKLFLDQVDDGFIPSENILCGAAQNVRCAMPMLQLIVGRFSEHVVFTENLLRAARHGLDVTKWLLEGYGDEFVITAELLNDVVVCHEWNLQLFIKYKHQELQQHATTALLALSQCSERCHLASLLDSYITASMITEEVLLGILRKRRWKMLMTDILEQFDPDLVISEGVLKRVVMVPEDAPYLLNMIKSRCPRYFGVTEGVFEAAATEGREDVLVFLSNLEAVASLSRTSGGWPLSFGPR